MTVGYRLDQARLERLTELLQGGYVDTGRIAGCQLLVAQHGNLAYQRNFGLMDREAGRYVADDTIFRIYSMTKPITAVALMMLYERGLFQLDQPIARFVPAFSKPRVWVSGEGAQMQTRPASRGITFRDLLTHTSGLTYGGELPGIGAQHPVDETYLSTGIRSLSGKDRADVFLEKIGQMPLRFDPGTQWMYSLASDVCGALVEIISDQPFADFLADNIFDPLGMVDTGFCVPAGDLARFAAPYFRSPSKKLHRIDDGANPLWRSPPVFASGGGGLVSTARDYLRFCEMLRLGGALEGERILSPRTLDLMVRNHLPQNGDLRALATDLFPDVDMAGLGFGLGFAMTRDQIEAGWLSAHDFFWSGAASTFFWVDPIEGICVVFMTQLMPAGTFDFRGQIKSIIYSSLVR